MDFTPLKNFMDHLTAWRIPGNSVSVCIDNEEVFSYQSGYENVEEKREMSPDVLFNIFSCSKPLTAAAALQLYEKGLLGLDVPLYDFIPEYKDILVKDENGQEKKCDTPITIRHLLTMTSGIIFDITSPAFEKAKKITSGKMNTLSVIKCMADCGVSFIPGTRWEYGYSLDVLAAVVEVVSGKRFRDYVQENIFLPLEMHESYYHNDDVLDRVATMYRYDNTKEENLVNLQASTDNAKDGTLVNAGKSVFLVFGSEYDSGSGGITTSVSDFSKFASAMASGGTGKNGERILSEETIQLMGQNQLSDKLFDDFRRRWPYHVGYSYGLGAKTRIAKPENGSLWNAGEFGWGGAAGSTILCDPKIRLSMFYTHHMLNPQEAYYQPRLRDALYASLSN